MTAIATRFPSAARLDAGDLAQALLGRLRQHAAIAAPVRLAPQRQAAPDQARWRSEQVRWIVLSGLSAAAPLGAPETILLDLARCIFADLPMTELRRELAHLERRGLAVVREHGLGRRTAKATAEGLAVADYSAPCPMGIGRPLRAF
ncbi:TPA: hypothetical protein UM673_000664 [Stenotrophomonas maltophilia]|nr:hypothetical protein [Stenotrophomonas maltophilia]HEL4283812.1 hypothetical protein [Stenotrophomonas maltophilia]